MTIEEKLIFLIQTYFVISFTCTFILLCLRVPKEIKYWKIYKRTYKDNLHFIGIVLLMLIAFPILAFLLWIKGVLK